MKEAIRRLAYDLGFDACGFTTAAAPETGPRFQEWLAKGFQGGMAYLERNANKRLAPELVLPGARSVVCLAVSYHRKELQEPANGSEGTFRSEGTKSVGVVARYARHTDYHDVVGDRLRQLTAEMDRIAGGSSASLWYVDTGPILERDLAQRAGVGFVGKHTNLISRGLGNWFLIGEILTTLELEPDLPERNRCGSCSRCLEACPTQAILAPFQLDARRCISYLTIENKGPIPEEFRSSIGARIFGCDDCLAVCPWNRFAREGRLLRGQELRDLDQPELLTLLRLTDVQFKQRFAHTPILRSKRKGLLRNVCVALGNIGDLSAVTDLRVAASDPEPLIAEHAAWALTQILRRAEAPR